MAKRPKKKKLRAQFRKNRESRARRSDLTQRFQRQDVDEDESIVSERISGKGDVARQRTVVGEEVDDETGLGVILDVDEAACQAGRVLVAGGLHSTVEADDGTIYRCATRRLLKTLATDQRHVVATGDRVLFRVAESNEGVIERVEPRHGVLCRTTRGRMQIIVSNVDQLLIITSAAEPRIKPNLIDRLLVTAEKAAIRPIICINKVDLVDAADLQPLAGVFGQLGYEVLFLSAETGQGVQRLAQLMKDRQSVLSGQSGVGKSSLLMAVEPGLELRVRSVSSDSQKGRHTTTAAQLVPLSCGGYVVDTPGIRQFQLWDVIPEEVAGFFRDVRPYVSRCRFPDCTHTHEEECAVKDAVADSRIDARRYESYCQIRAGDQI